MHSTRRKPTHEARLNGWYLSHNSRVSNFSICCYIIIFDGWIPFFHGISAFYDVSCRRCPNWALFSRDWGRASPKICQALNRWAPWAWWNLNLWIFQSEFTPMISPLYQDISRYIKIYQDVCHDFSHFFWGLRLDLAKVFAALGAAGGHSKSRLLLPAKSLFRTFPSFKTSLEQRHRPWCGSTPWWWLRVCYRKWPILVI